MTRNILLATLFTLATAVALVVIFLGEKSVRLPEASAVTAGIQIERGAHDYEQYCASCHGLAGQGYANAAGAPPLNNIVQRKNELTDPNDPKSSAFLRQYGVKEKYGTVRNYVVATLISGIQGTAMPAWGQQSGGPLRMDQIENITSYVLAWNGEAPATTVRLAETVAAANLPTADTRSPFAAGKSVFSAKGCVGCHLMNDKTLVGPGLGGLFDPEGTAAYGNLLPNGKTVDDATVKEWILKGSLAFPEKHVGLKPEADKNDILQKGVMPAIALTDQEYASLLNYLKGHNQDGSIKPGAEEAPAAEGTAPAGTPEAGTLKPTTQPTTQPNGPVQPQAPGTDSSNGTQPVVPATPSS